MRHAANQTARSRVLETLPLDDQEAEEMFDLSLVTSLEVDVVPFIADARVPDSVIVQLARTLHQGSLLNTSEDGSELKSDGSSPESMTSTLVDVAGTTMSNASQPRERFCYWCLDLLFLICSDAVKGKAQKSSMIPDTDQTTEEENLRRRIAALSLPLLLHRCRTTLITYLSDEAIRGGYPFPRCVPSSCLNYFISSRLMQDSRRGTNLRPQEAFLDSPMAWVSPGRHVRSTVQAMLRTTRYDLSKHALTT